MKTAELTGADLDYWVARAERLDPCILNDVDGIGRCTIRYYEIFDPSSNWTQGGPIMERENIGFFGGDNSWTAGIDLFANLEWGDPVIRGEHLHYGSTPLEAAMRTYVASKFGEEVPEITDSGTES